MPRPMAALCRRWGAVGGERAVQPARTGALSWHQQALSVHPSLAVTQHNIGGSPGQPHAVDSARGMYGVLVNRPWVEAPGSNRSQHPPPLVPPSDARNRSPPQLPTKPRDRGTAIVVRFPTPVGCAQGSQVSPVEMREAEREPIPTRRRRKKKTTGLKMQDNPHRPSRGRRASSISPSGPAGIPHRFVS